MFAGTANGNVNPLRRLQSRFLARTTHELAIDTVHDEIIAPNPFAQAILFYRADAKDNDEPVGIIQGPRTLMGGGMDTDNVSLDPVNNEVLVAQEGSDSVLVFNRWAHGDVAPVRVLHGEKTRLRFPRKVAVDPANNMLAVAASTGILIFDRTATGDTPPKCVISGPASGLGRGEGMRQMKLVLYAPAKKIIMSGGGQRVPRGQPDGSKPFTAVWKYGDCGDIPPLYRMDTGTSEFDVIPKNKEIIIGNSRGLRIFSFPEAF